MLLSSIGMFVYRTHVSLATLVLLGHAGKQLEMKAL